MLCNTTTHERLDAMDPQALRPPFKADLSRLQCGNDFKVPSIDGDNSHVKRHALQC